MVVDDTVDGKDNLEEKTREVSEIRITSVGFFFIEDVICCGDTG